MPHTNSKATQLDSKLYWLSLLLLPTSLMHLASNFQRGKALATRNIAKNGVFTMGEGQTNSKESIR